MDEESEIMPRILEAQEMEKMQGRTNIRDGALVSGGWHREEDMDAQCSKQHCGGRDAPHPTQEGGSRRRWERKWDSWVKAKRMERAKEEKEMKS